jgi:hypothetical protein
VEAADKLTKWSHNHSLVTCALAEGGKCLLHLPLRAADNPGECARARGGTTRILLVVAGKNHSFSATARSCSGRWKPSFASLAAAAECSPVRPSGVGILLACCCPARTVRSSTTKKLLHRTVVETSFYCELHQLFYQGRHLHLPFPSKGSTNKLYPALIG